MSKIESRCVELREFSVSPEGIISGYLSTYDDIDSYGTYMIKGCFDEFIETFKKDGYLPLLYQHQRDKVLGSWFELYSDDIGLFGRAKLTMDDPNAKVVLAHLIDRSIRGFSIGFRIDEDEIVHDKERDTYGFKKVDLMECSVVTFPANKNAQVTDVKQDNFILNDEEDSKMPNNTDDMSYIRQQLEQLLNDKNKAAEAAVTADNSRMDEVDKQLSANADDIEAIKREIASLKAPSMNNSVKTEDAYTRQFQQFIQFGSKIDTREDPPTPTPTPTPIAGNNGTNAQGGYLVPDGLNRKVVELLKTKSVIRQNASIFTPEGNKYQRPYKKTGIDCGWVGETSARPQTDAQTYDMITAELGELYAFPMYTQNFLSDSWYNVEAWFVRDLAEGFKKKEEEAFISGNGTNKPKGILTYNMSTDYDGTRTWDNLQMVKTGSATDITLNSLIKIKDSLNSEYKSNAKWYMNRNTYTALQSLLKDNDGRRVFGPVDLVSDAPSVLLGYKIEICDYMPDVAANANPIIFGDMKAGYTILDKNGIGIVRDELTNKPYIGFYSIKRVGGLIEDYRALKVLNIAA